ncbi:MAG: nucleotide exchange factor GrpE [Deltaproteobacteria bacterium HGW-Deltaproteobacteria-20]|nr:MAG: nucleotide exchange factor GrpE [Deltaproteobacteria bacterium HGW-Deltaproteobacteria-20]
MSDKDLIVLGAGPGGLAAAMEAASSGMRVVLINGSHLLGYGLHGAYKSKGMWELAKDLRVACKVGRGYAPSPSACVDFEQVYQQLTEGAEELSTMYLAQLSRLGIEFVPGFAHFVDPHTVEVEGRTFSGKYILVATGTRPRLLPGMVADELEKGFLLSGRVLRPAKVTVALKDTNKEE